jgi:3-dehydroquinate synthase class II
MGFFNNNRTRITDFDSLNNYVIELERKLRFLLRNIDASSLILGLSNSRLVASDSSGALTSVSNLASWIAGTLNQITVTNDGDGTITLSLPQSINTDADVEFDSLTLDDLTATRMVYVDAAKKLQSIADLTSWITGTANRVTIANDGDGTITISLPQDIHTDADVEFDSLILDDLTASRLLYTDVSKKLQSVASLTAWVLGTSGNLSVTDNGDGTVTLKSTGSIKNVTQITATDTLTVIQQGLIECNSAILFYYKY